MGDRAPPAHGPDERLDRNIFFGCVTRRSVGLTQGPLLCFRLLSRVGGGGAGRRRGKATLTAAALTLRGDRPCAVARSRLRSILSTSRRSVGSKVPFFTQSRPAAGIPVVCAIQIASCHSLRSSLDRPVSPRIAEYITALRMLPCHPHPIRSRKARAGPGSHP